MFITGQSTTFDVVYFAEIRQFPCLCIIGYANDLVHQGMFAWLIASPQ